MASLLEITLQKLQQSTQSSFPDTEKRQHAVATIGISNIKYVPYQDSNLLKVNATAVSGPKRYECSMLFEDVYYEQAPSNQLVTFEGVDGVEHNIHPLNTKVNDVKVKCSCMDFYYRFAQADYQNDGLDGEPPPPYVKKTDRPSVNPTNAPGMCKHLHKLEEQLETVGLLR
jgi:hypothetical protein